MLPTPKNIEYFLLFYSMLKTSNKFKKWKKEKKASLHTCKSGTYENSGTVIYKILYIQRKRNKTNVFLEYELF